METQQIRRAGKLVPDCDGNEMESKRVVDPRCGLRASRYSVWQVVHLFRLPQAVAQMMCWPRGCLCLYPSRRRLQYGWECHYHFCKAVQKVRAGEGSGIERGLRDGLCEVWRKRLPTCPKLLCRSLEHHSDQIWEHSGGFLGREAWHPD